MKFDFDFSNLDQSEEKPSINACQSDEKPSNKVRGCLIFLKFFFFYPNSEKRIELIVSGKTYFLDNYFKTFFE